MVAPLGGQRLCGKNLTRHNMLQQAGGAQHEVDAQALRVMTEGAGTRRVHKCKGHGQLNWQHNLSCLQHSRWLL